MASNCTSDALLVPIWKYLEDLLTVLYKQQPLILSPHNETRFATVNMPNGLQLLESVNIEKRYTMIIFFSYR